MRAEFERDLSYVLHSVTPEPPSHLAPPRVATLSAAGRADTTVIELTTASISHRAGSTGGRSPLAAAAVAALAAGVVALTHIDHGTPHSNQQAVASADATSPAPNAAIAPTCRNDQIVVSRPRTPLVRSGSTGTTGITYGNRSAAACSLRLPAAAIGPLVITASVRVTGRCESAVNGLHVDFTGGAWSYGFWLRVTGCTLTPVRLTHGVVG